MTTEPLRCSFCGKSQHDVLLLIAGSHLVGCLICEACTNECCKIVAGYLTDVHDFGARCSYKFLAEGA